MRLRKPRQIDGISREEIILCLSQARISAAKVLKDSPQFVAGYSEGIAVAIEMLRAVDDIEKAIIPEEYERR
jgi:hypothetical protein